MSVITKTLHDDQNYIHSKELVYEGDTFQIRLARYSDPNRLNLARNAAIYLGKADRDNVRRPLSIIKQGHVPAIFRGEMVEFEFIDVSKEVYDHLITYTTANMRAAGGNRALTSDSFTIPSDKIKNHTLVWHNANRSMENYKELLESGETPQVARAAMPTSAKLNPFVFQFNFLTLGEAVFKQRLWEKGAQGNTVKVVQGMLELCLAVDEDLWNTFYEYKGEPALEWEEVRKKLKKSGLTVQQFIDQLCNNEDEPYDSSQNGSKMLVEYLNEKFGETKTMW